MIDYSTGNQYTIIIIQEPVQYYCRVLIVGILLIKIQTTGTVLTQYYFKVP